MFLNGQPNVFCEWQKSLKITRRVVVSLRANRSKGGLNGILNFFEKTCFQRNFLLQFNQQFFKNTWQNFGKKLEFHKKIDFHVNMIISEVF